MRTRHSEKVYTEALGCYVSIETKEKFNEICNKIGYSKSDVLRLIIEKYVKDWNKDESNIF